MVASNTKKCFSDGAQEHARITSNKTLSNKKVHQPPHHLHTFFPLIRLLRDTAAAVGAANVGVTLLIRTGAARNDCAPSPPDPDPLVFLSTSLPIVVRRMGPTLTTGADRGLKTEVFQSSGPFTLPTIRRA